MELASESRIRDILVNQFNIDIREVTIGKNRYTVTVKDGYGTIVCQWGKLPNGGTMNGSRDWWVRKWEEGQVLPDHLREAIVAVGASAGDAVE